MLFVVSEDKLLAKEHGFHIPVAPKYPQIPGKQPGKGTPVPRTHGKQGSTQYHLSGDVNHRGNASLTLMQMVQQELQRQKRRERENNSTRHRHSRA